MSVVPLCVVYLSIATCSCCENRTSHGQLTVTEDLIRREILRLGGDWESGAKPVLVSFLGGRFESRHYEMLTHLPSVEFFYADNCTVDQFAFACLSQVRQLERLDLKKCKLTAEGLSLLRRNRNLVELHFESVPLSDKFVREIGKLEQLATIVFIECEGMTDKRLSELRSALPKAMIEVD